MSVPSVLAVETAALTAWPGLLTAFDGHWVWRAARNYSNRANSIHCLDPADGHDAATRIARLSALFVRHGVHPAFKLSPLTAPEILSTLATLDWETYEPSKVLRMEMAARAWTPRHHTALFDPNDRQWRLAQAEMSGYDADSTETVRLIIERIACEARGVLAYDRDGVPAAAALAAVAGGIAIFGNVVSRPAHRGQGFGRAVMEAALNWTRDVGAQAAAIQVRAPNAPAVALYQSLGFAHAYDYSYCRPRGAP
jgi:GNAT superfamily N-acetyltransferase